MKLLNLNTVTLKRQSPRQLAIIRDKIDTQLRAGGLNRADRTKYEDLMKVVDAINLERLDEIDRTQKEKKGWLRRRKK